MFNRKTSLKSSNLVFEVPLKFYILGKTSDFKISKLRFKIKNERLVRSLKSLLSSSRFFINWKVWNVNACIFWMYLDSISTFGEMKTQLFDASGNTVVTDVFLTCIIKDFSEKNTKKIVLKQILFLSWKGRKFFFYWQWNTAFMGSLYWI